MTLFIIPCDDLTVVVFRMFKEAALLSALMEVYTIPCHDRGHINVMLVLQSCTDPLQVLPGSSSETFRSLSDGVCNFNNMEVEEDEDVIEEGFFNINKEVNKDIKQEEIPEAITFPDIKSEPDKVSFY